jgi:Family of unknown function (DUF6760)
MTRYPEEDLWQEISYLGYHLHWDLETLLSMEHPDRVRFVKEVATLNERALEEVRALG